DEAFPKPRIKRGLDGLKKTLATHPKSALIVYGHTDSEGDEVYNRWLSAQRAAAVHALLVGNSETWQTLAKEGSVPKARLARLEENLGTWIGLMRAQALEEEGIPPLTSEVPEKGLGARLDVYFKLLWPEPVEP